MSAPAAIDTSFDFRTDSFGRDPDIYSPTVRRYHRMLWSRTLPCGVVFGLDDATPGAYLHHRSTIGEFFLSSDAVIPSFRRWIAVKHITDRIEEADHETFAAAGYTMGGMMIWPGNRVGGMMTINGARGFTRRIASALAR